MDSSAPNQDGFRLLRSQSTQLGVTPGAAPATRLHRCQSWDIFLRPLPACIAVLSPASGSVWPHHSNSPHKKSAASFRCKADFKSRRETLTIARNNTNIALSVVTMMGCTSMLVIPETWTTVYTTPSARGICRSIRPTRCAVRHSGAPTVVGLVLLAPTPANSVPCTSRVMQVDPIAQ